METEIYKKYVVIKVDDVLKYLTYEDRMKLGDIFQKVEKSRKKNGKGINDYLVVNRNEEYAAKVEKMILGGALNE